MAEAHKHKWEISPLLVFGASINSQPGPLIRLHQCSGCGVLGAGNAYAGAPTIEEARADPANDSAVH